MQLYGIGVDTVEIERIRQLCQNERFLLRFFGLRERLEFDERNRNVSTIAAAFAAKEAFSKALGTGLVGFALSDVQLCHEKSGKPFLFLENRAEQMARQKNLDFLLSITHTDRYATAMVVAQICAAG